MDEREQDDLVKLEERFLNDLEQDPIPIDVLLTALRYLKNSKYAQHTESWAQMALSKLVDNGDLQGLIDLLSLLAQWRDDRRSFGKLCQTVLKKASPDRVWNACVESVDFGKVTAVESLRRLDFLNSCQPGALCLDKTWGFGIVKRIDDFYKRMIVDFTNKPNHALSLANAGENLAFVAPEHILAVRYRDPENFTKQVQVNPAEVVRLALFSFGAVSVPRLSDLLDEHALVSKAGWRRFWDGARKVLKADPLVEIPTKRTEPIVLHEQAPAFDHNWFAALRSERDITVIQREIAALEATGETASLDDFARETLSDRLAFALKGARNVDAALYLRLTLTVQRLRLENPAADEMCQHLLDSNRFVNAAESISVRESALMVVFLLQQDTPCAVSKLLAALPEMNYNLLSVTVEALLEDQAHLPLLQARCRELLAAPAAPPTLLVWILRNLQKVEAWPLLSIYELIGQAIATLEDQTLSGEKLRMRHQLRALFEQSKWFKSVFSVLNDLQREAIFVRIYGNLNMGDSATQRALVGRMVKIDPKLAERKQESNAAVPQKESLQRWTSWRSLRERQAQFKRLIDVDIPKNSADIGHARSYGDLRENFEYQAAKQQQTILMSRRDEWDLELKQMRGTDFADVDTSVVGMGVEVTLLRADGTTQTWSIMGDWDRDETLNILPYRSRLAQTLEGQRVGEKVAIPGVEGQEEVTIQSIKPLSAAVRDWIGAQSADETV